MIKILFNKTLERVASTIESLENGACFGGV
jgi:hypothetical protein